MINITYRPLQAAESKIYRAIRLESLKTYPESFGASYEEALKTGKFRIESDIEDQTPERFVYGAFADLHLVGICVFVKGENNTGHIYQMYVKKDFQGQNIGFGLIQAVINEVKNRFNTIEILLEVTPGNDKAFYLYRKIGFKEIKEEISVKENSGNLVMKYMG
ncbi:GNAT family N-acetyltransferase [Chryseobacterium sp. MEBOG06]|uniref:GNAT family N-acetyltransferase n=1 Tax=unclassified Chryseobacterium TaxID=2593645 RepID=UPI001F3C4639|nr:MULTISPECIES: GNAT family N-acetyltransferase [unclassified Chryseobacterium]UKB85711.1 GNAT family N-acetyltransferase [Chryseobacterium sp. MEBOG06]